MPATEKVSSTLQKTDTASLLNLKVRAFSKISKNYAIDVKLSFAEGRETITQVLATTEL